MYTNVEEIVDNDFYDKSDDDNENVDNGIPFASKLSTDVSIDRFPLTIGRMVQHI